MKRKLLSIGVALVLVLSLLAGCGNGKSETSKVSSNETDANVTSGAEEKADTSEAERELVELTMLLVSPNSNETEVDKISAKVSEITKEKFNTTIDFITITPADYANKMNMMLATGDKLDIFQGFVMYDQFVAQGYMLPIEDYEEYYQDALKTVGDTIRIAKTNGHTYGIPFMNAGGTGGNAYAFRKDIIDNLGVNLDDVKGMDGLGDLLRKIKVAYPEMTPLMNGGPKAMVINAMYDLETGKYPAPLGTTSMISIYDPLNNSKVESIYEKENFKKLCDYAWQWAQEGLIGYDEVSTDVELVKAGKSAACNIMYGPQAADESTANTGQEMVIWRSSPEPSVVFTNNVWTWCIGSNCENPERALEVLNEFYINAELANLLEWGIEGEHYQLVDAEKGIVDFLPGQHPGNVGYFNFIKDNIPNCYISYVGVRENPNKWDLYREFKANDTILSPYLGFTLNTESIMNEISACTNVVDKYATGLLSGQLDPSTQYQEFIDDLKAVGIDKVVAEAQKQLDEWIAQNKQ